MVRLTSNKIIRLALAPLLVFWIAGMPCLFGCGMIAQATTTAASPMSNAQGVVEAAESCGSSKSHACCAKKRGADATTAEQHTNSSAQFLDGQQDLPSGSMGDCPMAVNAIAPISKVSFGHSAQLLLTQAELPPVRATDQPIPLFTPLRLPNRGHTYLRCCVFLI